MNTYGYDPYGNVVTQTGTTPNRWGFAGGYRDPGTGFVKFGKRYYDPVLGRWTQPAPEPASMTNPAIASTFSYVGGDPVNNVDPSGAWRVGWHRRRAGTRTSPPAVQADCGWFSCTIRFNRATTQRIAQGTFSVATLGAACVVAIPWAAPVCAPVTLAAIGASAVAEVLYLTGNCLGIRVWPTFMMAAPVAVRGGTYNCG